MLLTATFQSVVGYVQFSLTLCTTLTVIGVFVLRWRRPDLERPYRVWGYPFTPLNLSCGERLDDVANAGASGNTRAFPARPRDSGSRLDNLFSFTEEQAN